MSVGGHPSLICHTVGEELVGIINSSEMSDKQSFQVVRKVVHYLTDETVRELMIERIDDHIEGMIDFGTREEVGVFKK